MKPHEAHPGTLDRMVGNRPSAETGHSTPQHLPGKRKRPTIASKLGLTGNQHARSWDDYSDEDFWRAWDRTKQR